MFVDIVDWLNSNQGVLTLSIFATTLVLGWVSGVFSSLMLRPKLDVRLIEGPTFSCTFVTGDKHGDFDVHRTGIALYLWISNTGAAPTSINSVELGYHWHLGWLSKQSLRYRIGWFWLRNQCVALADFQVLIGENIKVFPFLTQRNHLSGAQPRTYLRVGESTNGVVYFEQRDSWGGCFPSSSNGSTKIKLVLRDAHGRKYVSTHRIPNVNIDDAKKFNPRFGETHTELNEEYLPTDETLITAKHISDSGDDTN